MYCQLLKRIVEFKINTSLITTLSVDGKEYYDVSNWDKLIIVDSFQKTLECIQYSKFYCFEVYSTNYSISYKKEGKPYM